MNLFDWELKAGESKLWPGTGRYLRLLTAQGDLQIQVVYDGGTSQSSGLIAGIGVDLTNPDTGKAFRGIHFTSPMDQKIRVLVSNFPTTDSRLSGDVDINGALSVISSGGLSRAVSTVVVPVGVAFELLPADTDRLKALLNFDRDVWFGADNTVAFANGFPIPAGADWLDENVSSLWVFAPTGAEVYIMEDRK